MKMIFCRISRSIVGLIVSLWLVTLTAHAQGSRKDDIVFGPSGHPIAGATVTVCQPNATGTPCSPLAVIYTDATLTVAAPNPFQTDGIGNYHFYAAPGRYQIQVSGPGITGTITYPDVILPADLSSSGSGNNISAFGLTLGGNLSVAGNATIAGTLTSGTFSPGNFSPTSVNVGGSESVLGPRPRVDVRHTEQEAMVRQMILLRFNLLSTQCARITPTKAEICSSHRHQDTRISSGCTVSRSRKLLRRLRYSPFLVPSI